MGLDLWSFALKELIVFHEIPSLSIHISSKTTNVSVGFLLAKTYPFASFIKYLFLTSLPSNNCCI